MPVSAFDITSRFSDSESSLSGLGESLNISSLRGSQSQIQIQTEAPLAKVKIYENRFEPQNLHVSAGTEVEWSIKVDLRTHTSRRHAYVVEFLEIDEVSDLIKSAGDSFCLKFLKNGTYRYKCGINIGMTGCIEVTGGSESTCATPTIRSETQRRTLPKPFEYNERLVQAAKDRITEVEKEDDEQEVQKSNE